MTFVREHDDLYVTLTQDQEGRIARADLNQRGPNQSLGDFVELTKEQLYALVNDVAMADPEEWYRRFPIQQVEAELALRRVADYLHNRAKLNRQFGQPGVAETFELAKTRVLEEIEELYKED